MSSLTFDAVKIADICRNSDVSHFTHPAPMHEMLKQQ